jgi:hypothetical protein
MCRVGTTQKKGARGENMVSPTPSNAIAERLCLRESFQSL